MYSISLNIAGKKIIGTGETAVDALKALTRPQKIMHKGVAVMEHEGKTKQVLFTPPKLKRLFSTQGSTQLILAKQLFLGMK